MANQTIARQTVTVRDAKGVVGRTTFYIFYDSAAAAGAEGVGAAMAVAIWNMSNGAPQNTSGPYGSVVPPAYGTAPSVYQDAEDKAVLVVQALDGTLHRYSIPCPKTSIFLADGQTVDKTNALVLAFASALHTASGTAIASTRGGIGFGATPFIAGQRSRRRTVRKMTIYTLSGNLDEPAE